MPEVTKIALLIWQKYKIELFFLIISLIIVIISVLIYFNTYQENTQSISLEDTENNLSSTNYLRSQKITVDLSGAVQQPNVYEIQTGSRLKDVLNLAKGLSIDADRDFFARNFNLARLLKDQEKIYIPSKNEVFLGIFKEPSRLIDLTQPQLINYQKETFQTSSDLSSKLNLNQASLKELEALPGVGSSIAQKIIQNKPFKSVDELLSKKIINKSVYDKIKDIVDTR